jgi:hypothetical protein
MLAADRLLLETNMKQRAIQLREKELNLFVENFSAVGTQAAVMAGFTTTCLIEISIPETVHFIPKTLLHFFAIFSICTNLTCVSLSTIVSVWGSGKALRGKEGSMDEAVDGMSSERNLIFKCFGFGLIGNMCTIMCASWILMEPTMALFASMMVSFGLYTILSNSKRIISKFFLDEHVKLSDLTNYKSNTQISTSGPGQLSYRGKGGLMDDSGV